MISRKFYLIIACSVFIFLSLSSFALAERRLEVSYPEIGGIKPTVTTIALPEYVKYIFNISIVLAGLVAFGILVYAGFRYLTSAGNMTAIQDAKERISGALLGLLVLFGSYLILTTINPQLTFFDLPELKGIASPATTTLSVEEGILHYTEIPVAGLAADLFSKIRMVRIENVLEEVKKSAAETKKLAEELKNLAEDEKKLAEERQKFVDQCQCGNTSPGGCFWDEKHYCSLSLPPPAFPRPCSGDPCSNRGQISALDYQIETKKTEIDKKEKEVCRSIYISSGIKKEEVGESCLGELTTILPEQKDRGLYFWQKKLDVEIIGVKKVYQDLLSAEVMMTNCSGSVSDRGKANALMNYSDFWQYREFLEKEKIIKKTEASRPYGDYVGVDSSNPYYVATFYCAEQFYPAPALLLSALPVTEGLPELSEKQSSLGAGESFCGQEILIGQTIDDAQELGQKLVGLLDNFQQETQNIIAAATGILYGATGIREIPPARSLMEKIKSYGCVSGCLFIDPEYETVCLEKKDEKDKDVCSKVQIVWPSCSPVSCHGTPGTKDAVDPKSEISTLTSQIIALFYGIDNLFTSLKNNYDLLSAQDIVQIREETVDLKENLNVANNQLGACYNSSETQGNLNQGKKVLWKELYSCPTAKTLQLITDCYSGQGKADNYFCCQTEVGF